MLYGTCVCSMPEFKPVLRDGILSEQENLKVKDLMTVDGRRWDVEMVR